MSGQQEGPGWRDGKTKWREEHYVTAYCCARDGMSNAQIAKVLGVHEDIMSKWRKKRPALQDAIDRGREVLTKKGRNEEQFEDFVAGVLPDNLKKLWQKIHAVKEERNAIRKMEALFEAEGKYARMHLWIYAYIRGNFNATQACKQVNVTRQTVDQWIHTEPGFAEIMDTMIEAKRDFIEGSLFKLIKKGDTAAVLFASRTLNRARGYADKKEIELSGNVSHTSIDLEKLNLPVETLRIVLDAVKRFRSERATSPERAIEYKRVNGNRAVPVEDESEDAEFELKENKDAEK